MSRKILLVDLRPGLLPTVRNSLRERGYLVQVAAVDVGQILDVAVGDAFDLFVLDMASAPALTLCRHIRRAGLAVPIMMLPARHRTAALIAGLNAGADDYVSEPLNIRDFLTRIDVLLRRRRSEGPTRRIYEFGAIRVDVEATEAKRDGKVVDLFAREFRLLQYLLEHPGVTFSREDLLAAVWGRSPGVPTRTVDVHVASLRRKLEEEPRRPKHLLTVHRLGYKLRP